MREIESDVELDTRKCTPSDDALFAGSTTESSTLPKSSCHPANTHVTSDLRRLRSANVPPYLCYELPVRRSQAKCRNSPVALKIRFTSLVSSATCLPALLGKVRDFS